MRRLISPLSGCALKAAFVSEGYFHEDAQSLASTPPLFLSLSFLSFLSLLFRAHTSHNSVQTRLCEKESLPYESVCSCKCETLMVFHLIRRFEKKKSHKLNQIRACLGKKEALMLH